MLTKTLKNIKYYWSIRRLLVRVARLAVKFAYRALAARVSGKSLVVIGLYEHIGDIIAAEPIIGALKKDDNMLWWATQQGYADIFQAHPQVKKTIKLASLTEWIFLSKIIKRLNLPVALCDLHLREKRCNTYGYKLKKNKQLHPSFVTSSLLASFSLEAGKTALDKQPVFYLSKQEHQNFPSKPYIVIHTGTNNQLKDWQAENWQQLAAFFNEQQYHVVEIGLQQVLNEDDMITCFTGAKSMQVLANLISRSVFFIGLDSGFAHMANALQKPGLVLLGDYKSGEIEFKHFIPFTGLYADRNYHLFSQRGSVAKIDVADVIVKLKEQQLLPLNKTYAAGATA